MAVIGEIRRSFRVCHMNHGDCQGDHHKDLLPDILQLEFVLDQLLMCAPKHTHH